MSVSVIEDAAKAGAATGEDLQARVAELERQNALDRAALAEAKRRGNASAAEAQRYKKAAETGQIGQVESQIASLTATKEKQQREYAEALAAGDFDKASEVQFAMSETASKLLAFSGHKTQLEAQAKAPVPANDLASRKDQILSTVSAPTAAWLRDHEKYFEDPEYNALVLAGHHSALAKKITPDTPEYFAHVEKVMAEAENDDDPGQRRGASRDEAPNGPRPGPRKVTSMPPTRESRRSGGALNERDGDRTYTDEMLKAAALCGITRTDTEGLKSYHDEYKRKYDAGLISDWAGIMRR
jgi:hypothetical protein